MSKVVSHINLAFGILVVAMGVALIPTSTLAQQIQLKPGAIKGEVLNLTDTRNQAFCEVYVGLFSERIDHEEYSESLA
jgi:hypothetical protein